MTTHTQLMHDIHDVDARNINDIVNQESAGVEATASMDVNHELLWESSVQLDDEGVHVTHDLD